jgi:hypothetical protein
MTLRYGDQEFVRGGRELLRWSRDAQDNEYWHLVVIDQRLREESRRDPRYMSRRVPLMMAASWALLVWVLARVDMRRSLLLNAEFEDHSERYYARLVDEHAEWEEQPLGNGVVREYGSFDLGRRVQAHRTR